MAGPPSSKSSRGPAPRGPAPRAREEGGRPPRPRAAAPGTDRGSSRSSPAAPPRRRPTRSTPTTSRPPSPPKVRAAFAAWTTSCSAGSRPVPRSSSTDPRTPGRTCSRACSRSRGSAPGIPSIWVVTDKSHGQVREDLAALYHGFADAEKKGMIRFVDLYSLSVGATVGGPRGPVPPIDREGGPRPARPERERLRRGAEAEVLDVPTDLRVGLDHHRLPRHQLDVPVPPAVHRAPEARRRRGLLRPRERHALGVRPRDPRAHGRRARSTSRSSR